MFFFKLELFSDFLIVLCLESVLDVWFFFVKVWNEIVKLMCLRDFLSNEEIDFFLFCILDGFTSESFFGFRYVVFFIMFSGFLFSGIGV